MTNDELLFFTSMPQMLPLYTALRDQLDQLHPDVTAKVGKTQISLRNRYVFATVSLPCARSRGGRRSICCSPLACPTTRSTPALPWRWSPTPTAGPTTYSSPAWTRP
nr:DUF5655 domain-containing protein [Pseudoflavonifractor capillosus]